VALTVITRLSTRGVGHGCKWCVCCHLKINPASRGGGRGMLVKCWPTAQKGWGWWEVQCAPLEVPYFVTEIVWKVMTKEFCIIFQKKYMTVRIALSVN
jgi:hypothetical protein